LSCLLRQIASRRKRMFAPSLRTYLQVWVLPSLDADWQRPSTILPLPQLVPAGAHGLALPRLRSRKTGTFRLPLAAACETNSNILSSRRLWTRPELSLEAACASSWPTSLAGDVGGRPHAGARHKFFEVGLAITNRTADPMKGWAAAVNSQFC
jgi:hypothetical protein